MDEFVFLSPHLDDAALSSGGHIWHLAQAGKRVRIITIMAGDPPPGVFSDFANELHERWALPPQAAIAARRAEDEVASAILGADVTHLSVPDAVYRRPAGGEPFYPTWHDVIGPLHPSEQELAVWLAEELAWTADCEALYAPLCVGNHVDHQLVRAAADLIDGATLSYYEDFPYTLEEGKLQAAVAADNALHSQIVPLTENAIRARQDAIWAYRSQRSTFFDDRAHMEQMIGAFVSGVGGERFWRCSQ
jgi:LmbE family N-acetylglucosaminyl deacetylase